MLTHCDTIRFDAVKVLVFFAFVSVCHGFTIDKLISQAMSSPSGYGFMFDEYSNMVKVDMDMIFDVDQWDRLTKIWNNRGRRQAIKDGAWPNGIVYYEIDYSDFTQNDIPVLHAAMGDWMRFTCVQFRQAYPGTQYKFKFVNGDGCSSHVGMVTNGKEQKLTLAKGCRRKGIVIHELGHVLGFYHEQARSDRDNYIQIMEENVPNHLMYNFNKINPDELYDLAVPYDYLSIMHYGKDAFSSNGQVTIKTLDYRYQDIIGNRDNLSFRDIKAINLLYNCGSTTPNCYLRDSDCPGEGFVSKDCTCWCPPGDPFSTSQTYYVCQPGSHYNPGSGGNYYPPTPYPGGNYPNNGGGSYPGGSTGCSDQHSSCAMWAARGECTANRNSMEYYCKRSCNFCNMVIPTCQDKYGSCNLWRNKGFCNPSSAFSRMMSTSCPVSCGFCSSSSGTGQQGSYTNTNYQSDYVSGSGSSNHVSSSCADVEPTGACEKWREDGECMRSAAEMAWRCRRTCGFCNTQVVDPAEESKPTTIRPCERKCKDEHAQCEAWALRGECQMTADYMLRYCRKACNTCCDGERRTYKRPTGNC